VGGVMSDALEMQRGGDVDFRMIWPGDVVDEPFVLDGWIVRVFEAHPVLAPHITLVVGDASIGELVGRIAWNKNFSDALKMSFRVQLEKEGRFKSMPPIRVVVK
jgi:hypothetical protein